MARSRRRSECELKVRTIVLESTATVAYRWYRFRDQPAMKQLAREFPDDYTEDVLQGMQTRVELMHTYWTGNEFIKKAPKVNHKVRLDKRLLVDIPDSVPDVGWVLVALSELYEASTGPGLDAGFYDGGW